MDEKDTLESRFNALIENLDNDEDEIIIPSPVLAEVLACARTDPETVLSLIDGSVNFRVVQFGRRAAMEFGELFKTLPRLNDEERIVHKFDLLIIAIAKLEEADTIYSADRPMKRLSLNQGIDCVDFQSLPRPASPSQGELPY